MRVLLGLVFPLTGCFITPAHDPIPLDQLTHTSVALQTSNSSRVIDGGYADPAVTVRFDTIGDDATHSPSDCPTISDSAVVTFDGLPLQLLDEGGWDAPIDGGSECHAISLSLDSAPPRPGQLSQLQIKDASATWTIEGPDLLTDDLTLTTPTAGHAKITATAYPITYAYVQFINAAGALQFWGTSSGGYPGSPPVTLADQVADIVIPAGTTGDGTLSINVTHDPIVSRCEGPTTCTVTVGIGSDFATTL
jgi:hypothetical protein